ncbi:MAG: low molecular weight phosphotyrosine protein phosphatase [Sphingobacteriales bacterium]|nr:low molecular weight phosphotyrosine protein phosphatase [Sphingobacteriales bacterium]
MKILMVCLGNICRSPLAHGILQHLADKKHLNWVVDSAGTAGYHVGHKPDDRSIAVAKKHGIDISMQRARQFHQKDFTLFDHIYVMDYYNYDEVISLAANDEESEKVKLFIPNGVVPDPYTDDSLFEPVFQLIATQCEKLLSQLENSNR